MHPSMNKHEDTPPVFLANFHYHHGLFLITAGLWGASLAITAIWLAFVLYLLYNGAGVLTPAFLFQSPRSMGREGGIAIPVAGTVAVVTMALLITVPVSVSAGIYLAHRGQSSVLSKVVRANMIYLSAVPSILVGLLGFEVLVIDLGLGWSVLSGALVLSILLSPTIVKLTEEAILAIPSDYKLGALALGASEQQLMRLEIGWAKKGIVGAILLALARGTAETSAVMLTVGGALNYPTSLLDSTRTLSLHLHLLAYEGISMERAFGTALVLVILVGGIDLLALNALRNGYKNSKTKTRRAQ